MDVVEVFRVAMRWAVGTLLSALIMAVLTMLLKHGKRWFRGMRKFIRTGRWKTGSNARWARGGQARSGQVRSGQTHRSAPTVERMPRLTLRGLLQAVSQLSVGQGSSTRPPISGGVASQNDDVPLDLKF